VLQNRFLKGEEDDCHENRRSFAELGWSSWNRQNFLLPRLSLISFGGGLRALPQ
jgi:hypothetical protein